MKFPGNLLLLTFFGLNLYCTELEDFYDFGEDMAGIMELEEELQNLQDFPVPINGKNLERLLIIPDLQTADIVLLKNAAKNKNITSRQSLLENGVPEALLAKIDKYITYSSTDKAKLSFNSAVAAQDNCCRDFRTRTRIKAGDINLGFFIKRQKADKTDQIFHPFYLQYNCYPIRITAGYYSLRWAQGLLHASAFRFGSSRQAGNFFKANRQLITPYLGSYENLYQMGCAVRYSWRVFDLDAFFSEAPVAVNFSDTLHISSFPDDLEPDRQSTLERIKGAALGWRKSAWRGGLLAEQVSLAHIMADYPGWSEYAGYSAWFEFSGSSFSAGGELACADSVLAGNFFSSWGNADFRQYLYLRSYGKDFPSIHGNPVSRKSHIGGEEGIYYGFSYYPSSKCELQFYSEIYHFPAERYLVELPSGGNEFMINLKFGSSDNYLEFFGKKRLAEQYHTVADSGKVLPNQIEQWQVTLNQFIDLYQLKSRFCYRQQNVPDINSYQQAVYFYQQISRQLNKLRLWARITAFRGETPHYLYENNIRSASKQVCLTGDGYRFSFLISCKWNTIKLELKSYYEIKENTDSKGIYLALNYDLN